MTGLTRWGLLLVGLAGCRPSEPVAAPAGELLVVTGLKGTTEPCGCTSHPLGGLDRLVGRLDTLRPAVVAFVGDTYFTPGAPQEQEPAKAHLIEEVLKHLGPDFVVTGATDAAHQKMESTPARVVSIDGTRVAIVTQQRLDCTALTNLPEADARVLLLAEENHDCEPAVDIVLVPGGEDPRGPRELGKSLWIDAGDRGRYIGHLGFHGTSAGGAWAFDDGGHAAQTARATMVSRLEKEIEALDDGPAKDARRARLEQLRSSTVEVRKPTGRYVSWSLDVIDASTAKAEWAAPLIAGFNKSLCELTVAATRSRTCEPPHSPADAYVGNAQCRSCHAEAFAIYNQTKHARAWSTLTQASKSCDLSCIGCHSVGYEKPGGYCRLDDVEKFENVGCENCHGPGAGHIAHPDDRKQWAGTFRRGRNADNCMQCHNHEHSDQFDFETYLPRILGPGHGAAAKR